MTETALDPIAIDRLIVTGHEQRPLAVVAMLATLYVPRGDDPVARQPVAALVDSYVAVAGAHLRWALSGEGRLRDLRKQPLASCVGRARELRADQSFGIVLSGADDFDDASPFGLSCLAARRQPPPNMGYLSVSHTSRPRYRPLPSQPGRSAWLGFPIRTRAFRRWSGTTPSAWRADPQRG